MSLDELTKVLDVASKAVTTLAILVGGGWASWRFLIRREHVWHLQITLGLNQISLTNNPALLAIRIALSNVGNVKIVPGPSGRRVSVRQLEHSLKHADIVSGKRQLPWSTM